MSMHLGGGLSAPALAALAGVMHLDLQYCMFLTDELLPHLPPSLCTLNVSFCIFLTQRASFENLTALTVLNCGGTQVVRLGVAGLPASLQELDTTLAFLPPGTSLAHFSRLRVLRAHRMDEATLASLPPCLLELYCEELAPGASFAHLPVLHTLDVSKTFIVDASLASVPPSLVSLTARLCRNLTPAAVLPPLPSLRLLDVSLTRVGDALVASLPAGLTELRMSRCTGVTASATLYHVSALRTLHSSGTDLAPGMLSDCRARGCAVPAAGVLRGHRRYVTALAVLADGRLVSGDADGEVRARKCGSGGGEADMVWNAGGGVVALAALRDGHRLAVAVNAVVEIWDVGVVSPVRTATVGCGGNPALTLAALRDGRLATGCGNGAVQIIGVDVVATLEGHTGRVTALAALPDGMLASGSNDGTVRVWNVITQACVATLADHHDSIHALAVLADGRLASGSDDASVRLWDVATRTCVGMLNGHTRCVVALAALPDGRLASGSWDWTLRVWDTRPAATAAASHAVSAVPMATIAHGLYVPSELVPLPDGCLACAGCGCKGGVHLLHLPPPAPYE